MSDLAGAAVEARRYQVMRDYLDTLGFPEHLLVLPAALTHDHEAVLGERRCHACERPQRPRQVLARLEVADVEEVRWPDAVGGLQALWSGLDRPEPRRGGVRDHAHPRRIDSQDPHDVPPRGLGRHQDEAGPPRDGFALATSTDAVVWTPLASGAW